jgi:hypothetical protein
MRFDMAYLHPNNHMSKKSAGWNNMTDKIVVKTKHGELTLEQLAETQPGMARLMKEVGDRYHILYYAAKGGNWKLAKHELNVIITIFKAGTVLRPKYNNDLTSFAQTYLNRISERIEEEDWSGFDVAYRKGIDEANKLHEKYGYEYIRYVLPSNPPGQLDLRATK